MTIIYLLKEKGMLFIESSLTERVCTNYLIKAFARLEEVFPYFLESLMVAISSIKVFYDEEQKLKVEAFEIQRKIKEVFTNNNGLTVLERI